MEGNLTLLKRFSLTDEHEVKLRHYQLAERNIMVNDSSRETGLRTKPAWKALDEHYQSIRNVHLRQLFSDDPERGERFVVEAAGLYLDYSKNRITGETVRLLIR